LREIKKRFKATTPTKKALSETNMGEKSYDFVVLMSTLLLLLPHRRNSQFRHQNIIPIHTQKILC
jgi:hypothetical protein